MKKFTKKQLNDFEKAIKAWVCPDSLTSDKSIVEFYKKDRADLRIALNYLKKGKTEEAIGKIYWLDTVVRDQVPQKIYDALI